MIGEKTGRYSSNMTKVPDFANVDHVTRVTIMLIEIWGIFERSYETPTRYSESIDVCSTDHPP